MLLQASLCLVCEHPSQKRDSGGRRGNLRLSPPRAGNRHHIRPGGAWPRPYCGSGRGRWRGARPKVGATGGWPAGRRPGSWAIRRRKCLEGVSVDLLQAAGRALNGPQILPSPHLRPAACVNLPFAQGLGTGDFQRDWSPPALLPRAGVRASSQGGLTAVNTGSGSPSGPFPLYRKSPPN